MGQTKSSGSSSHSMAKTQLLQVYFFISNTPQEFERIQELLLLFFKLVGTHTAEGALVIFRQLIAFVDIAADNTDIFLHIVFLLIVIIGCIRHTGR